MLFKFTFLRMSMYLLIIWFHLYEVQDHAELLCSDRSKKSGYLQEGMTKGALGDFPGCWKYSLLWYGYDGIKM